MTSQVISQGSGTSQDVSQGSGPSQDISQGSGVGQDIGQGSGEGLSSPHLFPAAIDRSYLMPCGFMLGIHKSYVPMLIFSQLMLGRKQIVVQGQTIVQLTCK